MKTSRTTFYGALLLAIASWSICPDRAVSETNFFCTVTREGSDTCITFPTNGGRWSIFHNRHTELSSRASNPGEKVCLTNGQTLYLGEKHSNYQITSMIQSNRQGLMVIGQFDGRSFGGSMETNSFFIEAENQ